MTAMVSMSEYGDVQPKLDEALSRAREGTRMASRVYRNGLPDSYIHIFLLASVCLFERFIILILYGTLCNFECTLFGQGLLLYS